MLDSGPRRRASLYVQRAAYAVMAYIVMVYVVMAYIVMAGGLEHYVT